MSIIRLNGMEGGPRGYFTLEWNGWAKWPARVVQMPCSTV